MRRSRAIAGSAVALAALSLLAAGCGGGGAPGVASVAVPTTTAAAATTQRGPAGAQPAGGQPAGGGSSTGPRGGNHTVIAVGNAAQGTRLSACMRTHGVPSFPDPDSQGSIRLGPGIDPRSPAFRTAMSACRKLLPGGLGPPTAAQLARVRQQLLAFTRCMRAHGIGDFPDPSGAALPRIQLRGDLDPGNPRFEAAYAACKADLPAGLPGKALGGLAPPPTG